VHARARARARARERKRERERGGEEAYVRKRAHAEMFFLKFRYNLAWNAINPIRNVHRPARIWRSSSAVSSSFAPLIRPASDDDPCVSTNYTRAAPNLNSTRGVPSDCRRAGLHLRTDVPSFVPQARTGRQGHRLHTLAMLIYENLWNARWICDAMMVKRSLPNDKTCWMEFDESNGSFWYRWNYRRGYL